MTTAELDKARDLLWAAKQKSGIHQLCIVEDHGEWSLRHLTGSWERIEKAPGVIEARETPKRLVVATSLAELAAGIGRWQP